MKEFELIQKYFNKPLADPSVALGIGDDAAILHFPSHEKLVVCVDTLVEGIHFLKDTKPLALGHQALAVNLSDMAAMGARPRWFTLALTLPRSDEFWVAQFSLGLLSLADKYGLSLVGGDTTQGPLTISVQVMGSVAPHQALLRSGAKPGDQIYVSGYLGDSGLGLRMLQDKIPIATEYHHYLQERYEFPEPRLALGRSLLGVASSAIDISDGLAADLQHILKASQVGACIVPENLPISEALKRSVNTEDALYLALSAGGDYELCFTVPPEHALTVEALSNKYHIPCTCIGEIISENVGMIHHSEGKSIILNHSGWEHFND